MYSSYPGLILGFHGCDEKVGRQIIAGERELKLSKNTYDWLGHGFYFWEFNQTRAWSFAKERAENPRGSTKIENPFVLGALIDLGHCLNLLDESGIRVVKQGYQTLKKAMEGSDNALPKNIPEDGQPLRRELDQAVIELIHFTNEQNDDRRFDSVRGVFVEGGAIYPGAGIHEKNHIQICVRNPNCIKGFFQPRKLNAKFARPHVG